MIYEKNPELKVRVFVYGGFIGIDMDIEKLGAKDGEQVVAFPEGLLNRPFDKGQLGFVVSPKDVIVSKEAKQCICDAGREGGSFAEIMVDESSFAWMGGIKTFFPVSGDNAFKLGRLCEPEFLYVGEVEVPESFKSFIDDWKERWTSDK